MMPTCSRAFSTDSIADGNDPSAPPCAAAITRSASMTPAIGACTMGNSVLNRSISLRSGHMVSSLGDGRSVLASLTGVWDSTDFHLLLNFSRIHRLYARQFEIPANKHRLDVISRIVNN